MAIIKLSVSEQNESWFVEWFIDGRPVGFNFEMHPAQLRRLEQVCAHFLSMFERSGFPYVLDKELTALGTVLFEAFFASNWNCIEAIAATGTNTLVICTEIADVLNIPWELVVLPTVKHLPLGCNPEWTMLRVPFYELQAKPVAMPGPIRIQFFSSAPTNQSQLDYDQEEDAMLLATSGISNDAVVLPFTETGSLSELSIITKALQPHIVHLSGHGFMKDGVGYFAFESERGLTDYKSVEVLMQKVFLGNTTRLAILNACQTSQAAVAGMAQTLVKSGVPLVLGWGANVADERAIQFITSLYRSLASGTSLGASAALARQELFLKGRQKQGELELIDATFALPQVYALGVVDNIFDPLLPRNLYKGHRTERNLLGDGIKGLKEGFVGRRREQQELYPALRDGTKTFIVLTGIGGAGKSTLATRVVSKLEASGFTVVPILATHGFDQKFNGADTLRRMLASFSEKILIICPEKQAIARLINDGSKPIVIRLQSFMQLLKQVNVAIVLDNFEDVLDLNTRQIVDPDLRGAYETMSRELSTGSRVIITCSFLPLNTPTQLPSVLHCDLKEFSLSEFIKLLRRDERIERHLMDGVINQSQLRRLYSLVGGTPGFLEILTQRLATIDPDSLELDDDPFEATKPLAQDRQQYFAEKLVLPRLFGTLCPAAQSLISKLALSELPLPGEALARLSETEESKAIEYAEDAAALGLVQIFPASNLTTLYHVPGLIRSWLSSDQHISETTRLRTHAQLAWFWKETLIQRCTDKRLGTYQVLVACKTHAHLCNDQDQFHWATVELANELERLSYWDEAQRLLMELPEGMHDHNYWHLLGTINLSRGSYGVANENLRNALLIRQQCGDRSGEASTLHQLACIAMYQGYLIDARRMLDQALMIRKEIGDSMGEVTTLHNLATIDLRECSYSAARELFQQTLVLRQHLGDRMGEASAWHQLAALDIRQGRYDEATHKFRTALSIRQETGDKWGEATTWSGLASVDNQKGDFQSALGKLHKALEIQQAIGHVPGVIGTLLGLAELQLVQGDTHGARLRVDQILVNVSESNSKQNESSAYNMMASIDEAEGKYSSARENLDKALKINQQLGSLDGEATCWLKLSGIDLKQATFAAARSNIARALQISRRIGDRGGVLHAFDMIGKIDLRMGKLERAWIHFLKVLKLSQEIEDRAVEAATLGNLSAIEVHRCNYSSARELLTKAISIQQRLGIPAAEAASLYNLATIDLNEGNYNAAREKFKEAMGISKRVRDLVGEASCLHQLGSLALNVGSNGEASDHFYRALAISQQVGDRLSEAGIWHQLATIELNLGKLDNAKRMFRQSLEIKHAIGDTKNEAVTWHQLSIVDLEEGNHDAAREQAMKALAMRQLQKDIAGEAANHNLLASIDLSQNRTFEARDRYILALRMVQQIGDRVGEGMCFGQLGNIAWRLNRHEHAIRLMALSFVILNAIGKTEKNVAYRSLQNMSHAKRYSDYQTKEVLQYVAREYSTDRGKKLLDEAFADLG